MAKSEVVIELRVKRVRLFIARLFMRAAAALAHVGAFIARHSVKVERKPRRVRRKRCS